MIQWHLTASEADVVAHALKVRAQDLRTLEKHPRYPNVAYADLAALNERLQRDLETLTRASPSAPHDAAAEAAYALADDDLAKERRAA